MKILELFCGTKSFTKVCKERGHECFTIDIDPRFKPDLCIDIMKLTPEMIPFKPDVIWASPPCQKFSVATIGRNWNKDYTPKNDDAKNSIVLVEKTLSLIAQFKPDFFFVENPRAMLRKMPCMKLIKMDTVSYCQYGEKYMKPTDIWNNIEWKGKCCKSGMPCHVSAPRGSSTGTQGLKDATIRGIVPHQLCLEIIETCEKCLKTKSK